MGHSAKDCPNALDSQSIAIKDGSQDTPVSMVGRDAVGICFRCGSTEHTLSKCNKRAQPGQDLPYATCFVCGEKGHLSSKCPRNATRGVYPEGGSCKLCGKVDHLAKDCPLSLRKEHTDAGIAINSIVGSTSQGNLGGDEDEFHNLARKRAHIHNEDQAASKKHKKSNPDKSSSTKVVSF